VTIGERVFFAGDLLIEGGGEVVIGDGVVIDQGLHIEGPGSVVLGDRVSVLARSRLQTQNRVARILIGERTKMRGPYFNCVREITVGRECMIARSTILDTDFHSTRADRHSLDSPVRVAPVYLGDNVWVAENAALLAGTRVGTNSVVGFGAVCMRQFPENVIILGNPGRVSAPIPSITEGGGRSAELASEQVVPLRELTRREEPW
jgi:acetyltransferase-like isoleucine patch superfamily enzyme